MDNKNKEYKESLLTQEHLKKHFRYNCNTGIFYHRTGTKTKLLGRVAGCLNSKGYIRITIFGKQYLAHRLAFLYMLNRWPFADVDHIDRNRSNNDWFNLRDATRLENMQNTIKINNVSGVSFNNNLKKWLAKAAQINGKAEFLGYFKSEPEAIAAREVWNTNHPDYIGESFK